MQPNFPELGAAAPEFSLPATGTSTLSLHSFAGRKLVLYFYPKDDTPGCTAEAIDFNRLKSRFADANTAVLGVSPDSAKSHDKFKTKHGLTFDLIADEGKTMLEAYGVWAEKSMYGKKYMGVERTTFLISPDGKVLAHWAKVKVPGHAEAVLAAAERA